MEAMKPEQPVDEVIPPVRLTCGAYRVSLDVANTPLEGRVILKL